MTMSTHLSLNRHDSGVARYSEPFYHMISGLKNVDRFPQLPGSQGAAVELAQDRPGLELGIGAFTGAAQPGMSAVGVLLRAGLVLALVRDAYGVTGTV